MDDRDNDTEIDRLRAEVAHLSNELGELAAFVKSARSADAVNDRAVRPGSAPMRSTRADLAAATPRRSFLRHGAAAAGALAAGAVAGGALTAQPAAAANGSALITGSGANQGTAPTGIEVDGSSLLPYGFGVTDNGLAPHPFSNPQGAAVLGTAKSECFSTGVFGYADATGTGVYGYSQNGVAVRAASFGSSGVLAQSQVGNAVYAESFQSVGAFVVGAQAAMKLGEASVAPPARSDAHGRHEVDAHQGSLWFCVAPGSPGSWRKVAGADTAGSLHILAATARVYDSRAGAKPTTVVKGPLSAGTERTIDATLSGSGVPVGAVAVLVNLTVTNTNSGGYVAAFAANVAWPGNSSINWGAANTTVANTTVVGTDSQSRFKVRCPGGVTDLVIDIIGYYR